MAAKSILHHAPGSSCNRNKSKKGSSMSPARQGLVEQSAHDPHRAVLARLQQMGML